MSDRTFSNQICIGDRCFDANAGQDNVSSTLIQWTNDTGNFGQAKEGQVCRDVNGVMVCSNIYPEVTVATASKIQNGNGDRTEAKQENDKPFAKANEAFHDPALDAFPWMVPPQLSAQYADSQGRIVARVGYTEPPSYYTAEAKKDVYQGPSAAGISPSIHGDYDPYSFHQGGRQRDLASAQAKPEDNYSFHQGDNLRPQTRRIDVPPQANERPPVAAAVRVETLPPVQQRACQPGACPGVQQPIRECPPGGCPGPSYPSQNQFNPCRPCNPCRSQGGWYPGKIVGRIFGGRRCR